MPQFLHPHYQLMRTLEEIADPTVERERKRSVLAEGKARRNCRRYDTR